MDPIDSLSLHDASATDSRKHETKVQRKARVMARKRARDAEKAEMKALEETARKKKLLENQKHEYEDRELTTKETLKIADRGAAAIKTGVMHRVDVWYAITQVRHGGYTDSQGKRHRTFDCLGYNQRNIVSEAAAAGHIQALRMMLEVGAATGIHDASGLTALHLSLANNHLDCACLLLMHDNWKEWKQDRTKKKLKQQKKRGLMVEGKEQVRDSEEDTYVRATDLKVKPPQCKAVLETFLRCPDAVVENGFCAKQSCKMQGFEMVKGKMDAARAKGEEFDAYQWNKNPFEKIIDNKPVAVARRVQMHHAVMIIEGLARFARRAFHGALDVVESFKTNKSNSVAKTMKKLQSIFGKRKQVGVQPTKKGVRNPYHDDLISLQGLLASYLGSPQTPETYGTVSVGSHVAQSLGLMIQRVRRDFPQCWSVSCEREYVLLMAAATDEVGFLNQTEFKESIGLWRNETTTSEWIMDVKRISKEIIKPKIAIGWDVDGYVG
jgi:hypothetical protein